MQQIITKDIERYSKRQILQTCIKDLNVFVKINTWLGIILGEQKMQTLHHFDIDKHEKCTGYVQS